MSKSVLSAAANLDLAGLGKAILADLTALKARITTLLADVTAIRTRSLTSMLSPAGLAIGGGAKKTAQAAKPFVALANGTLVYKAAATGMSVLSGAIAAGKHAIWAWYIDSAGTITTSTKTADADSVAAAFALMPAVPAGKAQIGFIIVSNGSASAFTGETTALDAANMTVVYVDTVGHQTAPVALTTAAAATLETIS